MSSSETEVYGLGLPRADELRIADIELFATVAFHGIGIIDLRRKASHNPKCQQANYRFLTDYVVHLADPTYPRPLSEDRELTRRLRAFDPQAADLLTQAQILALEDSDYSKTEK